MRIKKIISIAPFLLVLALAAQSLYATEKIASKTPRLDNPYPKVAKAYAVLVDDQWQWGKNVDMPLPLASLTKLMTAVLVVETGNLDATATVSSSSVKAKPFVARLKKGDKMTVRELLNIMLVSSANDACLALAEHIAGSEQAFVVQMNARAKLMGLQHTNFENACGFDKLRHRSTIRDLVALTRLALSHTEIADAVQQSSYRVALQNGRVIDVKSTNELIGHSDGVVGVKTGFTNNAGRCLIALSKRDQHEVLLVFLNARNRWWNAAALLERAFARVVVAS